MTPPIVYVVCCELRDRRVGHYVFWSRSKMAEWMRLTAHDPNILSRLITTGEFIDAAEVVG